MGKALIFSGVTVDSPLQTVTFVKELVTADDYVNEYTKLASEVTPDQKGYLLTFIKTLMSNGLWDKVKSCFPMLGGLDGYNKDLKDIFHQHDWNIPPVGVSWDSTRNAPFLSIPGLAEGGKEIHFDDLDYKNCAFLFSTKSIRANNSGQAFMSVYYLYNKQTNKSFISTLYPQFGGYQFPSWSTDAENRNIDNYTALKNKNLMYTLSLSDGVNKLYVNKSSLNSNEMMYISEKNTDISASSTDCYFAIGSGYEGEMEAPATNTLNGCVNMFIVFKSSLTEEEIQTVSEAVWDFDESCGRHIDFE